MGSVVANAEAAVAVGPVAIMPNMVRAAARTAVRSRLPQLFAGFVINTDNIPPYFKVYRATPLLARPGSAHARRAAVALL